MACSFSSFASTRLGLTRGGRADPQEKRKQQWRLRGRTGAKETTPANNFRSSPFSGMAAQGAPSDCLWWSVCFATDKEGGSPFWHFCPEAPDFSVWNCQIRNFGWMFGWITLKGLSGPKMEIVRKQRRVVASNHEMVMTKSFIFAMKCHPLILQRQIFSNLKVPTAYKKNLQKWFCGPCLCTHIPNSLLPSAFSPKPNFFHVPGVQLQPGMN